ncbi:MAG: hypothetical protein QNJ94_18105 [Alphaproteobacteria bacterium]|nr:hypothetical protein [Alphaproteobacteria bacterium]
MKRADVEKLEKIMGQLEGLHREISALARKSPNDGLNEFKLRFVNSTLANANDFLGTDYRPLDGFDQFDADELPTNSDVTFILASYLEEIERLRADNIKRSGVAWTYNLSDSDEYIRTAPPKKIKEKK